MRRRSPRSSLRLGRLGWASAARSVVLDLGRARLDRRSRLASGHEGPARRRGEVGRAGPPGDAPPARSEGADLSAEIAARFGWRPGLAAASSSWPSRPRRAAASDEALDVLDAALPDRGHGCGPGSALRPVRFAACCSCRMPPKRTLGARPGVASASVGQNVLDALGRRPTSWAGARALTAAAEGALRRRSTTPARRAPSDVTLS